MFGLGTGELFIIGAVVVLLFGTKRIPALGGSLAQGIRNFQKGLKDNVDAQQEDDKIEKSS